MFGKPFSSPGPSAWGAGITERPCPPPCCEARVVQAMGPKSPQPVLNESSSKSVPESAARPAEGEHFSPRLAEGKGPARPGWRPEDAARLRFFPFIYSTYSPTRPGWSTEEAVPRYSRGWLVLSPRFRVPCWQPGGIGGFIRPAGHRGMARRTGEALRLS